MFRKRMNQWTTLALMVVMMVFVMGAAAYQAVAAQPVTSPSAPNNTLGQENKEKKGKKQVLAVEIAEDATRFVFSSERLFDDGMPQYGTPYITQGYIYPEGTLNGTNGVLADGSPEFPDMVLGEWTCYGWMIGNGAYTETGPLAVSTQMFHFNESYENATIVTEGFEMADIGVPFERVISGGTGLLNGVEGQQVQELMGYTEQMAVSLSIELHLE